ncbi:MAG TPA: hypothetical protein VH087_04210 [Thermoanaerobaculia bacterium]|nr:hypothetical protein [Thermoanaerobaculia bacterium]
MIRKHRTALIAAAAFNFVLFFPTLFLGRVVSPNDVFYNYDPWTLLPHERVQNSLLNDPPTSLLTQVVMLKRGEAFHWDPYVGSGIPGAGWAALISPFILLSTFCVPIAWFYTALLFLKLNVAFFFAYLWLREERLGKRGAAIGALIFAGAGVYAVRWMWQATNATALYPALLWLVARIFHGKRNSIAVMSLIALSYALAGFPSTMSYGAYMAVAYAVFLWGAQAGSLRYTREVAKGALAVVTGLAIAAPFLAAFAGFVKRTGYLGARVNLSTTVFFPLSHFAMFLHPNRLGNNAYKDWVGDPKLGMLNNYYEATVYLGLITIPLVLLALANRRPRPRWFWVATTVVVLGAMFGLAPVVAVLGRLPGFRYTPLARCVMLLPLCAGYLSGAGAQWITRWRFRNILAAAIALLAAWDLGLFAGRFYPYLEPAKANVPETPTISYLRAQPKPFRIAPFFIDLWPNSSEIFQLEDIRSHFSSEAVYRRMMQRLDPTSWSGSSTVITFNSINFNFDDPIAGMLGVRYYVENKDIDIIKWSTFKRTVPGVKESGAFRMKPETAAQRVVHIDAEPFYALEIPIAVEKSFGPKPSVDVQLLHYGVVAWERTYAPDEVEVMEKVYVPIRPFARKGDSLTLRILTNGVQARLLQSVASPDGDPIFYGRVTTPVIFDRELPDGRLFLNLAEVPRFRAARQILSLTSEQFLARRDIDLGDTAVVTGGTTHAQGADASVSLTRYAPDEQRITTDSTTPFLLASSEKLTPELAITVDGKSAKPVEINALFAAVDVPAGQHRVLFSRRIGQGWWWAAIAGTIAFLLIAAIELLLVWRGRDLSS